MAFFKFRKSSDAPAPAAPAPESVQAMRRRARNRLVGAGLLVLAGVVGFPLLFDNQPRPIKVDIPIEIPDQANMAPPGVPVPANASEGAALVVPGTAPASPATAATASASAPATPPLPPAPAARASAAPVVPGSSATASAPARPEPKPAVPPPERTASKPADKPGNQGSNQAAEFARAQALLEGRPADKPGTGSTASDATGRFVVQFGAFTDAAKAREVRMKVEKAGLKTYEQVADTADGKKHRVRVGPFASRPEAEKAAEKIKKLDLPATILEL